MPEEKKNITPVIKEEEVEPEKVGFFDKIKNFFTNLFHNIKTTIKNWFTPITTSNKDLAEIYNARKKAETGLLNNYIKQKQKTNFVKERATTLVTETPTEEITTSEEVATSEEVSDIPVGTGISPEVKEAIDTAKVAETEENEVEVEVEETEKIEEVKVEKIKTEEIEEETSGTNTETDSNETKKKEFSEATAVLEQEPVSDTPIIAILDFINEKSGHDFEYIFTGDRLYSDYILAENPLYSKEVVICGTLKNPDSIILINVDEQGYITNVAQLEGQRDVDQSFENLYSVFKTNTPSISFEAHETHQEDVFTKLSELGLQDIYPLIKAQSPNIESLLNKDFIETEFYTYEQMVDAIKFKLESHNFLLQKDEVKDGTLVCQFSHESKSIDYVVTFSKDGDYFEIEMSNDGEKIKLDDVSQIKDPVVRLATETFAHNAKFIANQINTMSIDTDFMSIPDEFLKAAEDIGALE